MLEAFDSEHLTLSLQDISDRIGMAKATAFRLVNTLETAGYLLHNESRRYCLAPKILVLAGRVPGNVMIRDIVRPLMRELSDYTSETITFNEISGSDRLCIDVVDTPSPLMSIARPGETTPLVLGATGRILLAYLADEDRRLIIGPFVKDGTVDPVSLERELTRFRQQGYAITRGQRVPGITAIAAPIFDGNGRVTHSIALTGPAVRVDPCETEFVEKILDASGKISRQLGSPLQLSDDAEEARQPTRKRAATLSKSKKARSTEPPAPQRAVRTTVRRASRVAQKDIA